MPKKKVSKHSTDDAAGIASEALMKAEQQISDKANILILMGRLVPVLHTGTHKTAHAGGGTKGLEGSLRGGKIRVR